MVKPTVTVRVQRNTASYRVPKDLWKSFQTNENISTNVWCWYWRI